MKNSRREFIKNTGFAGIALGTAKINELGRIVSGPAEDGEIRFFNPIDGDMLNDYDGVVADGSLLTKVRIKAPAGMNITVNGIRANAEKDLYVAEIPLKDYRNVIRVSDVKTGKKAEAVVFRLKDCTNKYRLSLDDNIWFLKDISDNAARYGSIFENPYLSLMKEVHDTYGTKIHLNIFYQTDGFNLSQMTDKFKPEWKKNAGWLKLSFHALQNKPDKPYIHAGYEEVKKDCSLVMDQIKRFAGQELMGPVTTLHWGEATVEGCRALRDSGYTGLAGYFNVDDPEPVSYYLDLEKRKQLNNRFIWKDNPENIIFSRIALVINTVDLDKIIPRLDSLRSAGHKPAYIDLMIHEQYFYSYYVDYQPDYRQKVLTSVKWAVDNGYQPAFLSECIYG